MISKAKKKKILALVMTGMMTFMGTYNALAEGTSTNTTSTTNSTQQVSSGTPQRPPVSKDSLDTLVKAGTINQTQETAIINTLSTTTKDYQVALTDLVTAKTITAAEKTAVESALKPSGTNQGQQQGTPPSGNPPTGNPPTGTNNNSKSSSTSTGTAVYTLSAKTATKTNQTIKATNKDQSGIKVSKAGNLTISGYKITKTGNSSSEDNSNFYGLNSGVLAEGGSKINIKNTTINTNASGSNAIFSSGAGSKITISNVKINTTANSSRGLDATLTGTIIATNVDISTKGAHCAALATDRGNGTVSLTGGTLTTAGEGSPGIYSTGTISATNAKITATGSEAAVIEGKNTITLTNTTISGALKHGVMLYQSFSGDAEVGTSKFTMNGGSLKAAVGPLFYATNTSAIVELNGAKVTGNSGKLITASADSWGTKGSNGAELTFNANNEVLSGDITCDEISSIAVSLKTKTTLKGSINTENTAKSMTLSLDKTSTWTVTGTSYLTTLTDADTDLSNIKDNGNTIYYNSSDKGNSWLNGKTITLVDGGKLTPAK